MAADAQGESSKSLFAKLIVNVPPQIVALVNMIIYDRGFLDKVVLTFATWQEGPFYTDSLQLALLAVATPCKVDERARLCASNGPATCHEGVIVHQINTVIKWWTGNDYQRFSNDIEPLDTTNEIKEVEVRASENNYNEDLRDLGEILKAPLDPEETVQIDLWDFAGDNVYHNTHQAFMSKDAIYLVTFNVSENANEISLEDSRYDTDDSFEDLRSEILEIAQHTRTWDKKVPLKWIHLEKALFEEISSGQFISSINQIRNLAARTSHPITEHKEIESFLLYQHATGTYIYFEDLPEYVVLYPQWLANAFKSIVSANMFQISVSIVKEWEHFRKSGRLRENLLEHLFLKQSTEIKEYKDHILKVMEKLDIIVRPKVMLQSKQVVQESNYFVPCMMLTKDIRNIVCSPSCKSKSSWLCLEYDFLPPPLITCILVTCSRKWSVATLPNDKGGHEPIFYRDFALFHRPDYEDEMLLIAPFKNIIEIQVWKWGEQKRCYHILRQEIDSLLQPPFPDEHFIQNKM
ncbi:unnamed protein product [Mytilus coruscus]|uniref:COR domain-containing protein n=1 Tax=Mytilus coruscus TaxID=42192 RepID=A0A6J8C837_MYTCO|nr:unnamed protein product [Mytilus coruscus]